MLLNRGGGELTYFDVIVRKHVADKLPNMRCAAAVADAHGKASPMD